MKVISRKNIQTEVPVISTMVVVMALDFYNAPAFLWGVVLTVWSIYFIACVVDLFKNKEVDIFEDENKGIKIPDVKRKSDFEERVNNLVSRERERRGE